MSDQESKYLPITKLMQYWIMIRTILYKKPVCESISNYHELDISPTEIKTEQKHRFSS